LRKSKSKPLLAFEALTAVSHKGITRKFVKRYIVISASIPKNVEDLGAKENEEFLEAKQLCELYKMNRKILFFPAFDKTDPDPKRTMESDVLSCALVVGEAGVVEFQLANWFQEHIMKRRLTN
jgi:hypothetical protein